ncbi:MAG: vitamin K epoxide reductase family protein [Ardenticatenaceae bacterium]|nr:vitamin K epoxide reductase family protein [Ardenticatenaceae bacterium]MCB8949514.1 vitamin K epoxide reductase family protein [Ardenticatenaceae bacterium]
MKEDWQLRLIQLLSVPGMMLAFYLYLFHEGVLFVGCKVGSIFDCGSVSGPGAQYASIGPVPVAFIGLTGYAVIFLLTWLRDWDFALMDYLPEIMVVVTGFAFLFSLGLTILEAVVIHAFCQYCVVSAVLVVILFGLALSYLRSVKAEGE